MPESVGIGVVGLGFMGCTHVAAFARATDCEVMAVADRDSSRLTGRAAGDGNFDTGGEEMLFDPGVVSTSEEPFEVIDHPDVELVSVTTPTPTHHGLATAVISSGRHLLIEKPVDLDPQRILELAEAARDAGVLAMPAHCMRFWPAWVWMKARLDEQSFGPCRRAEFLRSGPAPGWNSSFYLDDAQSGGAVVDLHIHDTDFVLHCFGLPRSIRSTGSRRYVRTAYEYPNGPEVVAEGGWLEDPDSVFTMKARLECERATISFELGREPEILVESIDGTIEEHPEASVGGTGYDAQVRALLDAIRAGADEPPVTLDDAAVTARVLEAEIASAESGGVRIEL